MGTLKQASKILSLFEETPTEQVQAILESGLLTDLRDGNIIEVKRDYFRKLLGLKPINPPLLDPVGVIKVPATKQFIARDHFVVDTSRKARVKIAWLGSNFKNQFLGKIEAPAAEAKLDYAQLTRSMLDDEIRKEIGARREETMLAAIWALMERQPNGESGALLTNSYANIFYVRDVNGAFWAVGVNWNSFNDGWNVNANSVENPDGWNDGNQVFSKLSSFNSSVYIRRRCFSASRRASCQSL